MVSKTGKQGKTKKKERKDGLYLMTVKNKKVDAMARVDELPMGSQALISLALVGGLLEGMDRFLSDASKQVKKDGKVPNKKR